MTFIGDCRKWLPAIKSDLVDCCVTSPPYWGLRDYGVDGQIGLERSPDEYVASMVEVFREVRRTLKPEGTLWLNLGDSYAANRSKQVSPTKWGNLTQGQSSCVPEGLKPKDLVGIPWRVALALQADGWWLRQDIIWAKPNPMPESVKDRCTRSHEYVFLLSKSERYYYDAAAIAEPAIDAKQKTRNRRDVWTIAPQPCREAHFAVMPMALVEPCILAGCLEGGLVMDPFSGAGTVQIVAENLNRKFVGIELNPEYVDIAHKRKEKVCPSVTKAPLSLEPLRRTPFRL